MYNIILVGTHHTEFGKCTADELYKIIESVQPDIIFEELTQDLFDNCYKEQRFLFETPEIRSVKQYVKNYPIRHFPVDITVSDTLYVSEVNYLFNTVGKYYAYATLEEEQKKGAFQDGYDFLNSKKNDELTAELKAIAKSLVGFHVYRKELSRIYDLFYEEQHKREQEILKNIYNYSRETQYEKALLLLGSGHRKTIFEKIKTYEAEYHVKLNWALYGN